MKLVLLARLLKALIILSKNKKTNDARRILSIYAHRAALDRREIAPPPAARQTIID